jgi:hypothetical protein
MWKLIKAELNHGKERILAFSLVYCISIFASLTWVRWERNRITSVLLFLFLMPLVATYGGEKWRSEQKRDRLQVLLPVSAIRIGLSHLLLPLSLFVFMLGLYVVLIPVSQFIRANQVNYPTILQLLAVAGLILIVNGAGLLYRDLRVVTTKKYQRFLLNLFWFAIYIGALLPFYIVMNFLGWFGENTSLQQAIAGLGTRPHVLLLPGIGLSLLSLYVFTRRKSYVD